MVKDIRHLPRDIRKLVTEARAEAAAEIHESLQNRSPYWTGTFAESWTVSSSEVQATQPRIGERDEDGNIEGFDRPASSIFRQISQKMNEKVYGPLTSPVFIGNKADYAAFVINKVKHPVDKYKYEEMFRRGFKTTPRPNVPNWYDVYTKSKEIFKDMDKGFKVKGFSAKTTKPAGRY
tara:strand:- start:48 stop:581 length:534 start_codon:yes stop_codon:yes gene_type:complete